MHFGGSRQFNGFRLRPYGDFATINAGHQPDYSSNQAPATTLSLLESVLNGISAL